MMIVNTYRFTTTADNAPSIGGAYQGGYYAGDISDAGQLYRLVIAPKSGEVLAPTWQTEATSTPGAGSVTDGQANTSNMLDGKHPAAAYAAGYSTAGYTDWYLPARDEMAVIMANLRPGAATTPAMFKSGGAQALAAGMWYWTSTEFSAALAWAWPTNVTEIMQDTKLSSGNMTRPVRRVAV